MRMLRALVAAAVGALTAVAVMGGGGGLPGSAVTCQRSVAIDPQVTVAEASGTLTFVVRTNGCAQAGSVSYVVVDGTAQRPDDFMLENGRLEWAAGDVSYRQITATINDDKYGEPSLEDFRVLLINPSENVDVAFRTGQARVFDNDTQERSAAVVDDRICLISGEASCVPSRPGEKPGPKIMYTIEPGHMIIVPIILSQTNPVDTTILVETVDDGLVAGVDYVPVRQNLVIPADVGVVQVKVELLPHAYTRPGESFGINISSYTGGHVIDPSGTASMLA
ncbi:MAG TPA: Calx-beta domain-containing protein [Candidatus Limnocylindrales bacterium]